MARILIIDDDPQIGKDLSEILEEEGHEVLVEQDPEEGLKRIGEVDIILSDLMMPKMSGMDVLAYVKRHRPKVHVIMITAFATIENAVEAMKKGASDYISKPFKINEIQASIGRVLEEARFKEEASLIASDEDTEDILSSLANPIRRSVVELLEDYERSSFTEIKDTLKIDDPTKLSFHLRKLKSAKILDQDSEKRYILTARGKKAADVLKRLS
ncbi:MAG: response regulator [Euryarchaeota archaeon]|nr:response regulator [Euryarchaeota archaeon]